MSRAAAIAFWVVIAGQVVFLLAFIAVKEVQLNTGVEVTLQTAPVDPRSLLQGDYAILDYEIGRNLPASARFAPGDSVYITLRPGPEVWTAYAYYSAEPPAGEVFIQGRAISRNRAEFPAIATYFVPEGTGRLIDTAADVKVVVSLDRRGNAIIRQVLVDGRPFNP